MFGIPFTSAFVRTLVSADYRMKQVAAGTVAHPAGRKSFRDLGFEWMAAQMRARCDAAVSQPSVMARFWFHPTPPEYEEARNIFSFKSVGVQLLTEEEHLTASGHRVQTGHGHPTADAFRQDFTMHYRQAAVTDGVYAELRSCYRFIALSLFLKRRRALERSGADLEFWLRRLHQERANVPPAVAGVFAIKEDAIECSSAQGPMQGTIWMPMCGGVLVSRGVLDDESRIARGSPTLEAAVRKVLAAEPMPGRSLQWDVRLSESIRPDA